MEVLFTSLDGGGALRDRILRLIEHAATLADAHTVHLHAMAFAFTDQQIGDALAVAATSHASLQIRLLADWSQRIRERGQQAGRLAAMQLPNLQVRYSHDQPYVWDPTVGHMRWSYHASRGLLHHKTLALMVDGCPRQLICGSFNWTAAATKSYEHLLILTDQQAPAHEIMVRMDLEFCALWSDGRISLSPEEAQRHYEAILQEYGGDPAMAPDSIRGLPHGAGTALPPLALDDTARAGTDSCIASIAFAWRGFERGQGQGGAAEGNRSQRLVLRSPAGRARLVPLTMTSLALAAIYRATRGHTLRLAMYGLSPRVPEYAALLDAARRGVRVCVILDRLVGSAIAARLQAVAQQENLALEVCTAGRMMHQKYLVHTETATVVTGTANMSTDASCRHAEHRMLLRGDEGLAQRFAADFDQIWIRLKGSTVAGEKNFKDIEMSLK